MSNFAQDLTFDQHCRHVAHITHPQLKPEFEPDRVVAIIEKKFCALVFLLEDGNQCPQIVGYTPWEQGIKMSNYILKQEGYHVTMTRINSQGILNVIYDTYDGKIIPDSHNVGWPGFCGLVIADRRHGGEFKDLITVVEKSMEE